MYTRLKKPLTNKRRFQKASFSNTSIMHPNRFNAIFGKVEATPDRLNIEESTSVMYRLMSIAELKHIKQSTIVGNDPDLRATHTYQKRAHLCMPEHVQLNNSSLLTSFAHNPEQALNYAALNFIPNYYVLVKCNLPPVYTRPSDHSVLDRDPFDGFHALYVEHERKMAIENGTKFTPPVDAAILAHQAKEVDMVSNTLKKECDFRPSDSEMILQINYVWGGIWQHTMVNKPAPVVNTQVIHRDWAIEVLCPENETNYSKMLKTARDQRLIPPHSRPLTVEDAVVLFPAMMHDFPPHVDNHNHTHILHYVPEHLPIGSPKVAQFISKEHLKFRREHGFFSRKCSSDIHHHYIEANNFRKGRFE